MKQKEEIRSQKSTSQTFLSDGTKISTTEIIETDPNTNIQVETTTVVKEYIKEQEMEHGQILVEDVTETTVTRREWRIRRKNTINQEDHGETGMVGCVFPLCGGGEVVEHDDESAVHTLDSKLTMDSELDTFVRPKNTPSSQSPPLAVIGVAERDVVPTNNTSAVAGTTNNDNGEGRAKTTNAASSALAMLTSPAAFFRKTYPSHNNEVVEPRSTSPATQDTHETKNAATLNAATTNEKESRGVTINRKSRVSFDVDEEILNIVKKDHGKDRSTSNGGAKQMMMQSSYQQQQKQPAHSEPETQSQEQQSRQTGPSRVIEEEERQDDNSHLQEHYTSRSSPVHTHRPTTTTTTATATAVAASAPSSQLSRGIITPSPTLSLQSKASSQKTSNSLPQSSSQGVSAALVPSPATHTKSTSNKSSSKKLASASSPNSSSSKLKKKDKPPTIVKYNQMLLAQDSDFASPKLTVSAFTAAVTDDKYLHFFSYLPPPNGCPNQSMETSPHHTHHRLTIGKWRKSTTVSIENTYCISVTICNNTAVVGVPYDRNVKGLLTGAAYIFEREEQKDIWTQVKKIVPKEASEFATVGYSVGIDGDLIAVSVPNVGSTVGGGGGGSVHLYRRVQKYKWAEKGVLVPPLVESSKNGGIATTGRNKDVQITVVNKSKKGSSKKKKFGTRLAIQGNVVVVSDHYDHEETCVYVFEYDDFSLKWICIQDDLLTEAQQRHFGSRLALANNGNGILIGCHAKMSPTEILYYSRYGTGGKFHLQQVIVVSKRSSSYGVGRSVVGRNGVTEDITDFKVDGKNLIIGTTSTVGQQNQHCAYIYQLQTNDTWVLMAKVDDPSLAGFGQCVGLAGNKALIASRGNAYSYNLEGFIPKTKRKEFMATANLVEERKKQQPKPQVKYIDPEYLEMPYIGSDLNEFRTQQQVALRRHFARRAPNNSNKNNDGDKASQNSMSSPPRMSLSMGRPRMPRMLRMRSPSPILTRLRASSPKKGRGNVSAPPLRRTDSSMARR
ncbi:hypothetical protein HJC23_013818 [Cyclotella cryptica]|uniref:Uncharacterized protein n=1 Tax=Cyclotella cryptica TaxID=29204 RepID=A0ABD3P1G1_9STRA|eukprot:CCRYP_018174-RA/>CCRYP_018174-RA protein AED:0.05 eAED:0.05 QI:231/-1/1/1/-1/1/1/333/1009